MVCKFNKSIYGIKQVSKSWNICFNHKVKTFEFDQNIDEPCVYKKVDEDSITFVVLYLDDILLIRNDVEIMSSIKVWLSKYFRMKDLGEVSYVLGIKLLRDRQNRMLTLFQTSYIDQILIKYSMQDSKKGFLPFRHGIHLFHDQGPKTSNEVE